MKKLFFLFFLSFYFILLEGQSNYYNTDSTTTTIGCNIIYGTRIENASICKVINAGKISQFSPEDIIGYGFSDGTNFVSARVNVNNYPQKVFLQEIVKDSVSLYFFKDKINKYFFIKTDSSEYIYLKKNTDTTEEKNYQDILRKLPVHCEGFQSFPYDKIKYTGSNLKTFVKAYNNCEQRLFKNMDYGFYASYNISYLVPTLNKEFKYSEKLAKESDNSVSLGIYANLPIAQSNFNFHPEIYFQKSAFRQYLLDYKTDYTFLIDRTSICLPLLINYRIRGNHLSYFMSAGSTLLYGYANKSDIYLTSFSVLSSELDKFFDGSKEVISSVKVKSDPIISDMHIGYSTGAGIEFRFLKDTKMVLEARYTGSDSFLAEDAASYNIVQVIIGISLCK
ncbi:MAG: outer membrane beta-barrel protein [Bacteroidales bacterium]|nr:outer membrane beta-barrel protein [Bacteroidales bacterium]MCB8999209.1 outer membrane beta-barrel protein [Bacteroidales bacterium]